MRYFTYTLLAKVRFMIFGLVEIVWMPTKIRNKFAYKSSGLNYNSEDIFDSWQIWNFEIRKYKNIDKKQKWKT